MSNDTLQRLAFGPVPSRRLGRSLGINNIPPKNCSYACVYCQLGPTSQSTITPREFYAPQQILQAVEARLAIAQRAGERIDCLTFVPDGEPSLDARLGETIERLRPLGVKIAVISNASLVWRKEVRERLALADWLCLKLDAVDAAIWRRVNRPHAGLQLSRILQGIERMKRDFKGELATETLLVADLNDGEQALTELAGFLRRLDPDRSYLAVPTRPMAVAGLRPPTEAVLNRAFQLLSDGFPRVEYLIGYEGDAFASSGEAREDLLSISAVHPLREDAVRALLKRSGSGWEVVTALLEAGELKEIEFGGRRFYLRALSRLQGEGEDD